MIWCAPSVRTCNTLCVPVSAPLFGVSFANEIPSADSRQLYSKLKKGLTGLTFQSHSHKLRIKLRDILSKIYPKENWIGVV